MLTQKWKSELFLSFLSILFGKFMNDCIYLNTYCDRQYIQPLGGALSAAWGQTKHMSDVTFTYR